MGQTSLENTIRELQAKKGNNTHFMLVDGMSKLITRKVNQCQSWILDIFGIKWKLLLRSDQKKDYFSFFLYVKDKRCKGSNWEVRCSFKLSVVSPSTGENICMSTNVRFNEKQDSCGWPSFISNEVLKKSYIVDDKAIFYAEITEAIPNFPVGTMERLKVMELPRDNNSIFTWKITRFSCITCKSRSSDEFTVGQRKWKLEVYPKGDNDGVGHLSLFLIATGYVTNSPKAPTMAVYKLRVLDQLNHKHHEIDCEQMFSHEPEFPTIWGRSKFLSLEELHNTSRGFLVNDEIHVGVKFLYVSTTENLS